MKKKIRNPLIAKMINKTFRVYWFLTRPKTKGVKALIFNDGKILMIRLTYYPNMWTFPGGGVNKNEEPKDAVVRECEEEVGIRLQNPQFIKTLDFDHEYKKDTVHLFREEIASLDFKTDGKEIFEASWFNLNNLPSNIGKNAKKMLEASGLVLLSA